MTDSLFARNVPGMTEKLKPACVAVAGCGGLGSNAAAALARAGVGELILADFDTVEESNLNRQYFFQDDIGKYKVDALETRLKSINPEIVIQKHCKKIVEEDIKKLFPRACLMIEAFDLAESKKMLIDGWSRVFPEKPIVSGNGLSNLGGTRKLKIVKAGNIWFCGDMTSDMAEGLCSAKVAVVANMQSNVAIELIVRGDVS